MRWRLDVVGVLDVEAQVRRLDDRFAHALALGVVPVVGHGAAVLQDLAEAALGIPAQRARAQGLGRPAASSVRR